MPKLLTFKTKAIIYFQDNMTSQFYLLCNGQVVLQNPAAEQEEFVEPGNFFGSQATLIHKPQGDTAIATMPSEILAFEYDEFTKLIHQNGELLTSMLKNFVTRLGFLNTEIAQSMNQSNSNIELSEAESIYSTAEFFLKNRTYFQAYQTYTHFIEKFPEEENSTAAKERLKYIQPKLNGSEDLSSKLYYQKSHLNDAMSAPALSPMQIDYEEAIVILNQKKYSQALLKFTKLIRMDDDPAYYTLRSPCNFYISESLINLEKYSEAIPYLQTFLQAPSDEEKCHYAWYYLANAYEKLLQYSEAKEALDNVISMTERSPTLHDQAKKALERIKKSIP